MKHKVRFDVRSFNQEQGFDLNKMFAPTARFTSLVILYALQVKTGWHLNGVDVVSAYLHSPIDKETFYHLMDTLVPICQTC